MGLKSALIIGQSKVIHSLPSFTVLLKYLKVQPNYGLNYQKQQNMPTKWKKFHNVLL